MDDTIKKINELRDSKEYVESSKIDVSVKNNIIYNLLILKFDNFSDPGKTQIFRLLLGKVKMR